MSLTAIISDSHDHIANLQAVIAFCNAQKTDRLIHCGDLISPFMLDELAEFKGEVHLIYGNNRGDQHLISSRCCQPDSRIILHGDKGEISFDGLVVCFVHYPDIAREIVAAGHYDVVCFGHDHCFEVCTSGSTLLINPGHLMDKDGPGSFALLDSRGMKVKRYRAGKDMNDYHVEVTEA